VLELAPDLRLLVEALHDVGSVLVFVQQHLDSQIALQEGVTAVVHGAHAPVCDLLEQLVAAGSGRGRSARGGQRGLGSASRRRHLVIRQVLRHGPHSGSEEAG